MNVSLICQYGNSKDMACTASKGGGHLLRASLPRVSTKNLKLWRCFSAVQKAWQRSSRKHGKEVPWQCSWGSWAEFSGPLCLETPRSHVWCPQIDGRRIFTTTGADVSGRSADKNKYHCTQKDYRINSKTISVRLFLHPNYRVLFPMEDGVKGFGNPVLTLLTAPK